MEARLQPRRPESGPEGENPDQEAPGSHLILLSVARFYNCLNRLESVGWDLFIAENESLLEIDSIISINEIGGYVQLTNNDALIQIDGLNNSFIWQGIYIEDNDALENVNGLSHLTGMGEDIWIKNNASLMNIDGLANLTWIGENLVIENNPSLCQSLVENYVSTVTVDSYNYYF